MDFTLDEEQQAVADLASQILGDRLTMERHAEIEQGDEWFDRDTYAELAKSGLVGIALSEDVGGGGLDLVGLGMVLRAQGATAAPMPLLPTGLASLAIDQFGSDEQRKTWLPGVCDGSTVLSVAVQEFQNDQPTRPDTRFADGAVTGTKIVVEFATQAARLVVTASTDDGAGLFLVDPSGPGVTMTAGESTRGEPVHQIDFDGAAAEPLAGDDAVRWLHQRALALLCATQLGVTEAALKLTAEYTSTREQFGRPIATFQAVTQRLADQYINVGGIRLTTLASLWELANGRDASEDLHIAKYWASTRATQVAHATQHCHGGTGVSVDYPLHRYTLWNKHLGNSLGGGNQQMRHLGALLAAG